MLTPIGILYQIWQRFSNLYQIWQRFRTLAKLGQKGPFSGLDIGTIEFYAPDLPHKHTFMGYQAVVLPMNLEAGRRAMHACAQTLVSPKGRDLQVPQNPFPSQQSRVKLYGTGHFLMQESVSYHLLHSHYFQRFVIRHTHIIFQRFDILTHKTQAYIKVYGLSRRISFMIRSQKSNDTLQRQHDNSRRQTI